MRNEIELNVLKNEILATKKDVLEKLDYLISKVATENEIKKMKKLRDKVKGIELEKLAVDVTAKEINSYYIDFEGYLYKGILRDFYYVYDNDNHELYLSSFTADEEELII